MVVYQKWFEEEIVRWKVRRARYDLSKQLKKIHKQQRGKIGSGARPEEAVVGVKTGGSRVGGPELCV